MSTELQERIASCFAELQDPRQPINQAHLFIDILVISLCAIVCGADDWEAVADYAKAKQAWLATISLRSKPITLSCLLTANGSLSWSD
jgi:hypothetical protein